MEKFLALQDDKKYQTPWERSFNTSFDGPSINLSIWKKFSAEMQNKGCKGLLPFIPCAWHIVNTSFHKGIEVFLHEWKQLAYGLHAWFKISNCKKEYFIKLSEEIKITDGSMFLRHVPTLWLTLGPVLQRITDRWDDAKFLNISTKPKRV